MPAMNHLTATPPTGPGYVLSVRRVLIP